MDPGWSPDPLAADMSGLCVLLETLLCRVLCKVTAAAAAVVVLKTGGFHKLAANDSMTKECRYIYSTISTSLYCVLYCLAECLRKT